MRFPEELAHRLTPKRKAYGSEDFRVGISFSLALAHSAEATFGKKFCANDSVEEKVHSLVKTVIKRFENDALLD